MHFVRKTLVASLVIAWISVLIKYETFASDSSSRKSPPAAVKSSDSSHRLRQTIRETYHKVVDSKPKISSGNSAPSSSGGGGGGSPKTDTSHHRLSDSVRQTYHRIVEKPDAEQHSANTNSHGHRLSDSIRNTYHKIVDKVTQKPNVGPAVTVNHNQHGPNYPQQSGLLTNKPFNGYDNQNPSQGSTDGHHSSSISKTKVIKGIFGALSKKIQSSQKHASHGSDSYGNNVMNYDGASNNYQSGYYNNYNYRPQHYAQGSLCKNYANYDGVVYGQFYCPIEGFNAEDTRCCGPPNEQYCCNHRDYQYDNNYPDRQGGDGPHYDRRSKKQSSGSGLVFLFIILPMFICMLCTLGGVFLCVKKRIYRKLPMFASSAGDEAAPNQAAPSKVEEAEATKESPLLEEKQAEAEEDHA